MTKASLELMDSLDFLTFFWAPISKSVTNTFSSLKKRGIQLVSHWNKSHVHQVGATRGKIWSKSHRKSPVGLAHELQELFIWLNNKVPMSFSRYRTRLFQLLHEGVELATGWPDQTRCSLHKRGLGSGNGSPVEGAGPPVVFAPLCKNSRTRIGRMCPCAGVELRAAASDWGRVVTWGSGLWHMGHSWAGIVLFSSHIELCTSWSRKPWFGFLRAGHAA